MAIELFQHQADALKLAEGKQNVAFYHDMGLGKTYTGSEQLMTYDKRVNLVICQKSKINDWVDHFNDNYRVTTYDLTNASALDMYLFNTITCDPVTTHVGVINYELVFRRPELLKLRDFTLLLDEASMIQNERAKRSKFILNLKPAHTILLSGTPTGGKYEKLYSQLKLLGMPISKTSFYNTYVLYHFEDYGCNARVLTVDGYKNVDRLKRKMREYGCQFLKTDEVINLPDQIFCEVKVDASKEYKRFRRDRCITINGTELVGDNSFTRLLGERLVCGAYARDKWIALRDMLESTDDRVIIFYNYNAELEVLMDLVYQLERPLSIVNGRGRNLDAYESCDNSVTLIQYQAGAMGLNLQKANKIIYYTPPLSSELYEQSKKRVHRIGQESSCFYYNLIVKGSVEEKIYKTLAMRRDYTERLFEEDEQ